GPPQVGVGRGFAGDALVCSDEAVDHHLEAVAQARGLEHGDGVRGAGDHARGDPGRVQGIQVPHGARVRLDAFGQQVEEDGVLARAETGHGVGLRRVVVPLWELDTPRGEHRRDSLEPGPAIDVTEVVLVRLRVDTAV